MLVFTYGTLMRGEGNNVWMQEAGGRFVGIAAVAGFTMLHLGGFPGAVPGADRIVGEVFEVDDLGPLDMLEGHPTFYCREQVEVELVSEARTVTAWIYVLPGDYRLEYQPIASGSWKNR